MAKNVPSAWYDDDSFWELWYPYMFPERRFSEAAEQLPLLQALTGCNAGAMLDLACGPGRYVVPFAKQGYALTGVDRTRFLLDKARAYSAEEQVEVEFVEQDMRRFVRPNAFDLALNMFTSFGYFADPADNQLVLENVYASLREGGVFVLETAGKEVLASIFRDSGVTAGEDGTLFVQRRWAVNDWCEMDNEWILIHDDDVRTYRVRHWIYSGFEMKQMLNAAGFASVTLYGALDGSDYGPKARRLIAVARK